MENSNPNGLPDICKVRILDDPIDKVWKVISTSEGIALWFYPTNYFQPVLGCEFFAEMELPQGRTACKVTQVDPPYNLSYELGNDWSWSFKLKDLQGRTELTFVWSGWNEKKRTEFGMPHTKLHPQLMSGTNVLMKALSRSIKKLD
ncbi:SRPBCC family protein [Paenibacillus harenae]|uniref:SRPBCC family protein n=1 Tax=Paenibacillus harenae TaxID=306543 RepID=UPI000401B449|nr:SRPBCC domain-containing protein [Paenibacillus harenae]